MVTAVTTNSHEQDTKTSDDTDTIAPESPNICSLYESVNNLENTTPEVQNLFRALVQKTERMQDYINTLNGKLQKYESEAQESINGKSVGVASVNFIHGQNFEQGTLPCFSSNQGFPEDIMIDKSNADTTNILNNREILATSNNDASIANISQSSPNLNDHVSGYSWSNSLISTVPDLPEMDSTMDKRRTRQSWSDRYKQLMHYKRVHGHCDVPQTEETGLGIWLANQRGHYKLCLNGKQSSMTNEKKALLDQIGITWIIRSKRVSWHERFKELQAFSLANGHCEVTNAPSCSKLYIWIQNQRTAFKNMQQGKQSSLTPEKIQALESIGFNWLFKKDRVK